MLAIDTCNAFPSEASHDWLVLIPATEMLKASIPETTLWQGVDANELATLAHTFVNVNYCNCRRRRWKPNYCG